MKAVKRKRTSFGGGSYVRRHGQGYQAVSGVVVTALAIATLALHHFGFGFALILALGTAVLCGMVRANPTVATYVVGMALLAGVLMTPMTETPGLPGFTGATTSEIFPLGPNAGEYELYVLEGPSLTRPHLRPAPFEADTRSESPEPDELEDRQFPLPSKDSPRVYES